MASWYSFKSCGLRYHRFLLALVLSPVTLLFFGREALAADAPSQKPELRPFTVGMIVPLSGPLSFFGRDYSRAYEMAIAQRPEIAERFVIRWEDSAYDSKQAISAFNKLVSVDKADLIVSFGGPMLNVLAPLAEARKVPFYATESNKEDCEGRLFCVLFRNEEREWGEATWHALRKRGYKKIGIVKNQNQFMNTFVKALIETKRADESVTILIDTPPSTTDLRTEIIKLRDAQVDTLGIYLLPSTHHGFLAAAKTLRKVPPLFGVEEFLTPNNRGFEDIVDGALVIAPWSRPEYQERFRRLHGYSAGFFYTPAVYDLFNLLADTLRQDPTARGLKLMADMRFSGVRQGESGDFSFRLSDKGVTSYSFPIGIYRVTGDSYVTEEIKTF